MSKNNPISSKDVYLAVGAVVNDKETGKELTERDADSRFDCTYVKCNVVDESDELKTFEVFFNYDNLTEEKLRNEDIWAMVEVRNGNAKVINWDKRG